MEEASKEPPKKKPKFDFEHMDLNMKQIISYYNSIGQRDKAYVLKKVHESEDPELSSKLKSVIDGRKVKSNMMTNDDAAALLLRADMSQYNIRKKSEKTSSLLISNQIMIT